MKISRLVHPLLAIQHPPQRIETRVEGGRYKRSEPPLFPKTPICTRGLRATAPVRSLRAIRLMLLWLSYGNAQVPRSEGRHASTPSKTGRSSANDQSCPINFHLVSSQLEPVPWASIPALARLPRGKIPTLKTRSDPQDSESDVPAQSVPLTSQSSDSIRPPAWSHPWPTRISRHRFSPTAFNIRP